MKGQRSRVVVVIGGASAVGSTTVVRAIRENCPHYHLYQPRDCSVAFLGGNVGSDEIEQMMVENFRHLPNGVTVVDAGSYVFRNEQGTWQPFISYERFGQFAEMEEIGAVVMVLLGADEETLQQRRLADPYLQLRSRPTGLPGIRQEIRRNREVFEEYMYILERSNGYFREPYNLAVLAPNYRLVDLDQTVGKILHSVTLIERINDLGCLRLVDAPQANQQLEVAVPA